MGDLYLLRMDLVTRLAHCTAADIENWLRRLNLTTQFQTVDRGSPRRFSQENSLEIAFISALTKCGVPPRRACSVAGDWIMRNRAGTLPGLWVVRDGNLGDVDEYKYGVLDELALPPDNPSNQEGKAPAGMYCCHTT